MDAAAPTPRDIMTRSETILTNLAIRNGRITISGDTVVRDITGTGWQYMIRSASGNQVRCLLGKTFAEAKAALQ